MKLNYSFKLFLLLFLMQAKFFGQTALSGAYNVPGTYPTIGAAINALNAFGVTGPVVINIAAGHTETAITGPYVLTNVVGS
jgi:hypothetical protein